MTMVIEPDARPADRGDLDAALMPIAWTGPVRPVGRFDDDRLVEGPDDDPFSDDELAALALAADPDAPLPPDSVPWGAGGTGLLPDWYMPGQVARRRRGWRTVVALAVVVGLVAINAAGLCITYGHLVIA